MSKYIIKNCPSFYRDFCSAYDTDYFCCDETDCIIKQVIEKCKNELGKVRTIGKDIMAEEILQLCDIEECE